MSARDRIAEILAPLTNRPNMAANDILAALPSLGYVHRDEIRVKPLQWEDFDGRGAKAKAWGQANYLITKWSTGKFQVVESYPGYEGALIGDGFYPTLEAAKAAAEAHHAAQVLAALDIQEDRTNEG